MNNAGETLHMTQRRWTLRHAACTATAVAVALLLAACTGHKKDATQSAARVDGTEITVHEINFRLQRERGLRPEQMLEASRRVLEQLIDEQLIVEKAEKTKMDLQPQAQQAIGAASREVLARAYVEEAAQGVQAPTEAATHSYYDSNDALFAHRRIYVLQEYLAKVSEDQLPALRAVVEAGKPATDVEAWFKARGVAFRSQESTHPAEQIPLTSLKQLAAMRDGDGVMISAGDQVHVTYVASSTLAPVGYDRAKPAISQFMAAEAKRKATEANLAALRSVAQITYSAPYQALASPASTFSMKDVSAASQPAEPVGAHVTLPLDAASGVRISLPAAGAQPGVRVSLPSTPTSSVEVRLPPQTGADAAKN